MRYTPPPDTRPRPIHDAATTHIQWIGAIGSTIVAAVGFGWITLDQGDAITGLLGLIPGMLTAAATVLTAFGIVRHAEPEVTPLQSPRARDGSRLTALHTVPGTGPSARYAAPTQVTGTSGTPADTSDVGSDRTITWWDDDMGLRRGGIAYNPLTGDAPDTDGDGISAPAAPETYPMHHGDPAESRHDRSATPAETAPDGSTVYTPPDTYPVADTPAHGHHSASTSSTDSSPGPSPSTGHDSGGGYPGGDSGGSW